MAATNANIAAYPLKDIPQPHPHDVLCGRGGGTNNHIGNSHWRMLVAANKQLYITLPKRQKMLLSRSIVNAVRSQNPPGRFLQKDSKTNFWFDVGDQRAQEKTSQALREGAPDIRNKIAQQKDKKEDDVESTEVATEKSPGDSAKPEPTPATSSSDVKQEQPQQEPPKATAPKSNDAVPKPSTQVSPPPQPPQPQAPPGSMPAAAQANPMLNAPFLAGPPQMQAGPGQTPQFVMNGGTMQPMNPNQMPGANPQGMLYYAGPNMTPMQVYPTMVLNEQGTLVPAMSVVPTMMPHQPHNMMGGQQQQGAGPPPTAPQTTPQTSAAGSAVTAPTKNQNQVASNRPAQARPADPSSSDLEPLPADSQPLTFDEYMAMLPPGALEPAGLSFGSITMTDAEQRKLESTGTSFGSVMSYNFTGNQRTAPHVGASAVAAQQGNNQLPGAAQATQPNGVDTAPAALDSLEPTGISFGDVSMMSVGKGKLENTGTSFGSMMSYTAVEGGLEAIGTSFGSLSLDTTNKESLFKSLELAAAGPTIPPMFQQQKSTGNLLECSDTESEDSEQEQQLVAQRSAAWENMQATFAAQRQKSRDLTAPENAMGTGGVGPPKVDASAVGGVSNLPSNLPANLVTVPATNFERDFSALSAWEGDNDAAAMPPPPPIVKHDSEGEKLEMFYLQRGSSLGGEDFQNNNFSKNQPK